MDSDRERIYQNALLLMEGHLYEEAAQELGRIPDYRDAAKLRTECEQKKEAARLDDIYEEADKAAANRNVRSQEKAIRLFGTIPGWRDADQGSRRPGAPSTRSRPRSGWTGRRPSAGRTMRKTWWRSADAAGYGRL